jgi:enoyl-[acyl-carrier protein] reductase II
MAATSAHLQSLWQRGCDFLGTPYAIMGGAMSWVSEHKLVSAMSNAGAFGVIANGSMPPELLEKEIIETRKRTTRPFGVNLIIMHPQLEQLIEVCKRQNVSHVVLAGGIPNASHVKSIKDYGGKVMGFAPSAIIGRKLVRIGMDALVIEGMEAGGHIGPVTTSVLAQEVLPQIRDVPVFIAGGIGRGEAIVSYLEMGASGVQLGTRFVCASECIAHDNFKALFVRSQARDAIPSVQLDPDFPVIPVRAIANKATDDFMRFQKEVIDQYRGGALDKKEAQLKIEHFWAGALRRAVIDGDVEHGSVMAGQSVGMVSKVQPIQEIVDELLDQAVVYINARQASMMQQATSCRV